MNYKKFLGAANAALMIVVAIFLLAPGALAAGNYKTLHNFTDMKDGFWTTALIFDKAGNLYSITTWGGAYAQGNVFELTPNLDGTWTETELYAFCAVSGCPDGANPSGLIFDQAGNLYGTTQAGGAHKAGAVFKLSPSQNGSWTESVIYSFADNPDGAKPPAGLIFDRAGNLYGTTAVGGISSLGTVFKLAPNADGSWSETILHHFTGGKDGAYPWASLIFDPSGNLYGTTETAGGDTDGGIAFELTPNSDGSWTEKVLHRFTGGKDGHWPLAGVVIDTAGSLYGTTRLGGPAGDGVVFQLTPKSNGSWAEKVLHRFTGKDGSQPEASLVFDAAGNLYGTTFEGGNFNLCTGYGCGVVFKLSSTSTGGWKETVIHTFELKPGAIPLAALILDNMGNLYGTGAGGYVNHYGSVFEITP